MAPGRTAWAIIRPLNNGEVAELADAHALGACGKSRGGSSPPFPIDNAIAALGPRKPIGL